MPLSERDPTELSGLFEDFVRALDEGLLGRADDILDELESGVEAATPLTVGHWTFARTRAGAAEGRQQLETARLRRSLIDILDRGRQALVLAEDKLAVCAQGDPGEVVVDELSAAIEELEDIFADGEPPATDDIVGADIMGFWQELSRRMGPLQQQAQTCAWQQQSNEQLDDLGLEQRHPPPASADAQWWTASAGLLRQCAELLSQRRAAKGFSPHARLKMPAVNMTLAEASAYCEGEAGAAETESLRQQGVELVRGEIDKLAAARAAYEVADSGQRLMALPLYAEALAACAALLGQVAAGASMSTPFGALSAAGLGGRCVTEGERLRQSKPMLQWQVDLETLERQAKDVFGKEPADLSPTDRVFLDRCLRDTATLAQVSRPDHAGARPSRGELRRAKALWRACDRHKRS